MPKRKERSEVEFYRGQVRELTKRVQQLERQLTRYQRAQHMVDAAHELILELGETIQEAVETEKKNMCKVCNEGEMLLKFDFPELKKKIHQCTACGRTESNG